ncbi:Cytochrome c family protein [hydrothermal vent metagenome]|uniref:Cytochrome c family protein n=1 Tax=hydrothermal vent metagenome TaxID=652676 RepID=A0A3B1CPR1_9ZZZZ
MNQTLKSSAWCSFSAFVAVATLLVFSGGPAFAGIADTKHNLGTTGSGANHLTTGTAEICVFCHTPHGADNSAVVPLWNRNLGDGTGFTTYASLGTSTLDAKTATLVGSVSIACLSCHDGTQAMDVMINQPGSGGYNPSGAAATGNVWAGSSQLNDPTKITTIGTDLSNDHPIGIQYAGGGYSTANLTASGGTTDPDFNATATALVGSTQVWWIDTSSGTTNTREKTDILLYTRAAGDGYSGQSNSEPFVECASCHDPHNSINPTFLRISNDGSAVCLACHNK